MGLLHFKFRHVGLLLPDNGVKLLGNSSVVSKLPTEAKMGDMEIVRQFNSEVSMMSCRRVFNENHFCCAASRVLFRSSINL